MRIQIISEGWTFEVATGILSDMPDMMGYKREGEKDSCTRLIISNENQNYCSLIERERERDSIVPYNLEEWFGLRIGKGEGE